MKALAPVACAVVALFLLASGSSLLIRKVRAQQVPGRIASEIDNSARSIMAGTRPPMAKQANDVGRVAPETSLQGISIVFKRSAAQEAQLQALIAAQQNPSSPLYHHWLTPDEFAARFGMSDSDIAKVEAWLQQQGFTIDGVSRSRNRITFSGTADQVHSAFGTELHYYNINGKTHYAPSTDLSIPSALAPVVQNVTNLSTFRPKPRFRRPKANFTSSQSGHTFLTPKDVATIYHVTPAYTAGLTGAGQAIAVVGQTSISLADVENFEAAAGLATKDPKLVFVPGSGNVAEFPGDESESDLDVEYSGGMAPGATIFFVYVGDSANFSVFDSMAYAIDNDIAPIISDSYGICETALGAAGFSQLNAVLSQGASQGQSIIVPSGDNGSPDCQGVNGLTTAQQQAVAVDFPASSQYVTAMGGTEFLSADVCNSSTCTTPPATFWQPASGTDVISSALTYIPEQVWNDDAPPSGNNPAVLSSGGGGISALSPRPSWQSGVPGIPTGTFRLVPDISLSGSPNSAGFLYCSSDPSIGITGSCSHGFRDANTTNLTVAGGTSFDAPIFSGLVALINEKENSTGQGVISPILYQLASNSTTYASAFHDIKTGNNNCSVAGATLCTGSAATQYSAGTGYDMASGLGSIDFNNLLSAWPPQTGSTLTASSTTVTAASDPPTVGTGDTITIDVASGVGSVTTTPTGTVKLFADNSTPTTILTLSNGSATYSFVASAGGSHVIRAIYSGDTTFGASTSTLTLGNQGFRLTASSPTIVAGSSGTSTVTITPQQGYTGSISWTTSSSPALTNGCISLANATVSSATAVNAIMTVNTSSKACGGSAMLNGQKNGLAVAANGSGGHPPSPSHRTAFGVIASSLLLAGVFACKPGKFRGVAGMILLAILTLGLPACGGGSSSGGRGGGGGGTNVAPGTYNVTVVGKDTVSSAISGSVGVTVTVN